MVFGVPTYSAALIARVKLLDHDDDIKNRACPALPVPNDLSAIAPYLIARLEAPTYWATSPDCSRGTTACA